jgi:hypothetical protein
MSARTLREAHEFLHRQWPGEPTLPALLAYHEQAAALYRQIAELDVGHQHEALFWAQQEREAVAALTARLAASP